MLRVVSASSCRVAGRSAMLRRTVTRHFSSGSAPPGLWGRYVELLEAFPFATKVVTSAFIVGGGDIACQKLVEKQENLDTKRLGIMTFLGGALVAPVLHFWYGFLGTAITLPGHQGTAAMLVADQFAFAPAFIAVFMSSVTTLEGNMSKIPEVLNGWWDAVKTNWIIWIPAQLVNFALVPLQFRVLFANVVALGWNTYLSWATHSSSHE